MTRDYPAPQTHTGS